MKGNGMHNIWHTHEIKIYDREFTESALIFNSDRRIPLTVQLLGNTLIIKKYKKQTSSGKNGMWDVYGYNMDKFYSFHIEPIDEIQRV